MSKIGTLIYLLLTSFAVMGQGCIESEYDKLDESEDWTIRFSDDCTEHWQTKWHLDGLRADVFNNQDGMVFSAGPVAGDDACHAVLWTKESFKGDIKVEYEYTRTDAQLKFVNILYIQATGTGSGSYKTDIFEWNDLRIIPSMNLYYKNMNAIHISYAAMDPDDKDNKDYIRVRRYPVISNFNNTEIPEASFNTGLFVPGKKYKITAIKTTGKLYFRIEGQDKSEYFKWDTSVFPEIIEGRVGLRHMYTSSALYKDFKIYTK
ncbi:DUF1961 family protein [Bacteroidota bacterium]